MSMTNELTSIETLINRVIIARLVGSESVVTDDLCVIAGRSLGCPVQVLRFKIDVENSKPLPK